MDTSYGSLSSDAARRSSSLQSPSGAAMRATSLGSVTRTASVTSTTSVTSSGHQQPPPAPAGVSTDQAAQAAQSLQLLLQEDPLLQQYGLVEPVLQPGTRSTEGDDKDTPAAAFAYAAALLQEEAEQDEPLDNSSQGRRLSAKSRTKQRASLALSEVERKLALVESLAVKLSRTRPEAVAGHLLRLHGHAAAIDTVPSASIAPSTSTATATLSSLRDKSDRLQRQADTLQSVAQRVEGSLQRGLSRMETACQRLERVLALSKTLKQIMRLLFETTKCRDYDVTDLRDLTRAAASVAVLEELFQQEELSQNKNRADRIAVVEALRPQAQQTARTVRQAAAALLQQQQQPFNMEGGGTAPPPLSQLGATLQVYYHLGELPDAVWKAVDQAHVQAEATCRHLWNATMLLSIAEQAKKPSSGSSPASGSSHGTSSQSKKRLVQVRAEAAGTWAEGMVQAATQVRNLERVLARKTDPVTRQAFGRVVAAAPVPAVYRRSAQDSDGSADSFCLFDLFWHRTCRTLGLILQDIATQDGGKFTDHVAGLYPAVRSASLDMMSLIQESATSGASMASSTAAAAGGGFLEDASSAPTAGILGGSSVLQDPFLAPSSVEEEPSSSAENPQAPATQRSAATSARRADQWTQDRNATARASLVGASTGNMVAGTGGAGGSLSAILSSTEWKTLEGRKDRSGLFPLQQAFLQACSERLHSPLQYLFPEHVSLDEDGVAISSGFSLLPSKYDVQRFDETIRQELSLADPREGGGDLTAVTMIAACIVSMIAQFCARAKNAMTGVAENALLKDDWSMTESFQHDRKVAAILYTVGKNLRNAPEKTFLAPYRPATTPQQEEAASMCQKGLAPAQRDIDKVVRATVILPLCRALNRRIASVMARMHLGVYRASGGSLEEESPAFVQKYLSDVFERIAQHCLSKFPPEYAGILASRIASFTIYAFVSNASLVRPMGETARLHITQDLADLEMALEQFFSKVNCGLSLGQIDDGKPYAELRAVRQLLFWTGLEDKDKSAHDIAKSILRELWMKDVRPSTVCHYLFSYAPSLLSSPHHAKRMKADEYVATLVHYDGSVDDGEDSAWMTTMSCCDSYQQRASSTGGATVDGDDRVAQILLSLGPELMRRRRN